MANPSVLYEVKDQVAYITLNRPEKLNCVNVELITELANIWERFEEDPSARVAIFSGAGRAFCAGIDLTESSANMQANRHLYLKATRVNGITVLKPIVGAVHGYALGTGWGLATRCCDITVAAEGTQFGYPEPAVGRGDVVEYVPYMPLKMSLVMCCCRWHFIASLKRNAAILIYSMFVTIFAESSSNDILMCLRIYTLKMPLMSLMHGMR